MDAAARSEIEAIETDELSGAAIDQEREAAPHALISSRRLARVDSSGRWLVRVQTTPWLEGILEETVSLGRRT
jgi:hypothetical protein